MGTCTPTASDFLELAREGNLVPVYREILADTETPVSAYLKIARGDHGFLLESVQGGEKWARYSFLGSEPAAMYSSRGTAVTLRAAGGAERRWEAADPLAALKDLLAEFGAIVERAKEYIRAGDVIQVVLAQRMEVPLRAAPFNVYRALRTIDPSPYMFYLQLGEQILVGASPEVMVRVEDGEITVRPIAGTSPRGTQEIEDRELERALLADPKEIAEHVRLLDPGRTDVGRVAATGS